MPLLLPPLPPAPLPLQASLPLLAVTPGSFIPFQAPTPGSIGPLNVEPLEPINADRIQVDSFDPEARARLLAEQMPRLWRGALSTPGALNAIPAELVVTRMVALGQMLDITGSLSLGGATVPVQANINAESDQLDLLLLGDNLPAGLEAGGGFQGLEMLRLSNWEGPRLTSAGAILELAPATRPAAAAQPVRGLW